MGAIEYIMCINIFMLFSVLIIAREEVYIVTVEGEPIISYKGGELGFEATAVESDEKIDPTRYTIPLSSLEVFVVNAILHMVASLKCR